MRNSLRAAATPRTSTVHSSDDTTGAGKLFKLMY